MHTKSKQYKVCFHFHFGITNRCVNFIEPDINEDVLNNSSSLANLSKLKVENFLLNGICYNGNEEDFRCKFTTASVLKMSSVAAFLSDISEKLMRSQLG